MTEMLLDRHNSVFWLRIQNIEEPSAASAVAILGPVGYPLQLVHQFPSLSEKLAYAFVFCYRSGRIPA
jgi:hypothetical protein